MKRTIEEIRKEFYSPWVKPNGLVPFSAADMQHDAHRLALMQSEVLCLPVSEYDPILSINISKRLRQLEVDAKRDGVELFPDSIVEEPAPTEEWKGVYPGMCLNPAECKGRTCCPRQISCCE